MPYRISSTELARMSRDNRKKALTALVDASRRDGAETLALLKARIHQFEIRYEKTSEDMLRALADGTMTETAEVAEWLFLLGTVNEHGRDETRS